MCRSTSKGAAVRCRLEVRRDPSKEAPPVYPSTSSPI